MMISEEDFNMIELQGKYAKATVYADLIEPEAIKQIQDFTNHIASIGSKIVVMPDVHAGKGCVVGFTMDLTDAIGVVPNLVGVDIGCGMTYRKLDIEPNSLTEKDFARVTDAIKRKVPYGFDVHNEMRSAWAYFERSKFVCEDHIDIGRAGKSLGTLGGGNHFIEIDQDEEGYYYLIVHSGSRKLGLEVANHYQKLAIEQQEERLFIKKYEGICQDSLIAELKRSGRENEIQKELEKRKKNKTLLSQHDKQFAYLAKGTREYDNYMHDMQLAQRYASMNRKIMITAIKREMEWVEVKNPIDPFAGGETIHNYINFRDNILRKGAIATHNRGDAGLHDTVLIPLNMADGCILATGINNPDWNNSAPHGAGRTKSRSAAKKEFTMEQYRESMEGVYSDCVREATLDECKFAYKDSESIAEQIDGLTVTIEKRLKPVYNFKG